MKIYISNFKLRFVSSLQYRAAALAGIPTQIFFGLVYIMVYLAFYESNDSSVPMNFAQLASYLWLNQIFFSLINMWYRDQEIFNLIKNGNISYELCRPVDIYNMWYSKVISTRLASVCLRAIPVTIVAFLLPDPIGLSLPASLGAFLLFLITLIIGTLLMTSIITLYHVLTLFTMNEVGVTNIFMAISDILSGLVIPIVFFPPFLQTISNFLPFKYISDFPFRIYAGNIPINEVLTGIIVQVIWVIILIFIGKILMKYISKRMTVQGG